MLDNVCYHQHHRRCHNRNNMLVSIKSILVNGRVRQWIKAYYKTLPDGHRRRWLKRRSTKKNVDKNWRINSPCQLSYAKANAIIDAIDAGINLPAIQVRRTGRKYIIVDGRHRFMLYLIARRKIINVNIV